MRLLSEKIPGGALPVKSKRLKQKRHCPREQHYIIYAKGKSIHTKKKEKSDCGRKSGKRPES